MWDRTSNTIIEQRVSEPLVLELDEALTFCANSVAVGNVIVMPACPSRIGRMLERWGYDVCLASERIPQGGRGSTLFDFTARYDYLDRSIRRYVWLQMVNIENMRQKNVGYDIVKIGLVRTTSMHQVN